MEKNSCCCVRLPGKASGAPSDSVAAVLPSTSGWLELTNTPMLPSSAAICVVWMWTFRSRISWSRLSSKSLGLWPLPLASTIWALTLAMLLASALICTKLPLICLLTESPSSSSRSEAPRMRMAVSSMRVSATLRAVMSVGALATPEKAFIMSLMAAPSPEGPPLNTSCSCVRRSKRALSPALTAAADAAWRVSKSLWVRKIACTSTPWPM